MPEFAQVSTIDTRNGTGKSTTIRMILGLDAPTSGRATVNGRAYAAYPAPLAEVGTLLDARAVHPGRTARNHLLALAATNGISRRRMKLGLRDRVQAVVYACAHGLVRPQSRP